ncbi:MAG: hypothetical protein ACHQM6_03050 [Candidatus Kapaibacterium sp.]
MKNISMSWRAILLVLIAATLFSCNRPEGKDLSKSDPTNNVIVDTSSRPTGTTSPTPTASGPSAQTSGQEESNDVKLIPAPSAVIPDAAYPPANGKAPIGSVPVLRPEQLVAFHPKLPDFYMVKPQIHEEAREVQSIIFFKYKNDTTRTIRSIVMDANERAASKLIWDMSQMSTKKQETEVVAGESITSHYLEINGMPAIKAYIASRQVATLFVLVGDHRAISLRESHVTSADHLIEAAKTIDFKKLEAMTRN